VVESLAFVERVKNQLGVKAAHRDVVQLLDGMYCKAAEFDAGNFTGRNGTLSSENTIFLGIKAPMKRGHSFCPTRRHWRD
jgi:hypothetical protein